MFSLFTVGLNLMKLYFKQQAGKLLAKIRYESKYGATLRQEIHGTESLREASEPLDASSSAVSSSSSASSSSSSFNASSFSAGSAPSHPSSASTQWPGMRQAES